MYPETQNAEIQLHQYLTHLTRHLAYELSLLEVLHFQIVALAKGGCTTSTNQHDDSASKTALSEPSKAIQTCS
jgi:hypothetical protein